MRKKRYFTIILFFFLFFVSSCINNEFAEDPFIICRIYNSEKYLTANSIPNQGTIRYEETNEFHLPIDMNNTSVTYVFKSDFVPNDTLTLNYDIQLNPHKNLGWGRKAFTVSILNLEIEESQTSFNPDEIVLSIP